MDIAPSALPLPPAYRPVALRDSGDAFGEACRRASVEGAGAFFRSGRAGTVEWAVVLEPEEPLAGARRAVFAGLTALADAVSALAPPEKPVTIAWPATLLFDGARIGGGRIGVPDGCAEDEVPDWLVFGASLFATPVGIADAGAHPGVTWLDEEGFEPGAHEAVVAGFASHLMRAFDLWTTEGFEALAAAYLARLAADEEGRLDDSGTLTAGRGERAALRQALAAPSWLDPATGLPRLSP